MNILEMTHKAFIDRFRKKYGKGEYHGSAVYRHLLKNNRQDIAALAVFSADPVLAGTVEKDLKVKTGVLVKTERQGKVVKFITGFSDGLETESVIVPMENHNTICISSQVGCRMGCGFCETGSMGLVRNLTVPEIVGQVYTARARLNQKIRNVVFMGMGEPFDNFDAVQKAIAVMSDQRGMDIAQKHITLSTAGRIDGISRLAISDMKQVRLAVSLNAPNDEIRSLLMPINKKMPMAMLKEVLLAYPLGKKQSIFIEYVLIKGINDGKAHALQLSDYLKPLKIKLNLIPLNPGRSLQYRPPTEKGLEQFRKWLVEKKVFVRKRAPKGNNIMAACGQLGNRCKKSNPKK